MRKCLSFNLLEPTNAKRRLLQETYTTFLSIVKEAVNSLDGVKSRGQLHNKHTKRSRASTASHPNS